MDQLKKVQERITSLDELKGIFRAMRVMAASHVHQSQAGLEAARHYSQMIEIAISRATPLMPGHAAPMGDINGDSGQIIAVCSEHGFVGGLNEKVLDQAKKSMSDGNKLLILGQRGLNLADEHGLEVKWFHTMPTGVAGIPETVTALLRVLDLAQNVRIIFARYLQGGQYIIDDLELVPIETPQNITTPDNNVPPMHHLPPAQLIQQLLTEYLFAKLALSLIEALASESAARLQIMLQADVNIDRKLDVLTRERRARRQEAITSELLDVVAGSEAF